MSNSLRPRELHHARLPCPSLSPGACSNSCPLNQWCHPTISSCVTPFSSCPQSFPASESFPMTLHQVGQNIRASASASVFLMNSQGWFPFGLTGLISLQSKGLSRVFSGTTVQKHQFFGAQPSLWYNSLIRTWLLEIHNFDIHGPLSAKLGLCFLGGSDGKESACNAGDLGSIPGLGRSPGEGNGYPL